MNRSDQSKSAKNHVFQQTAMVTGSYVAFLIGSGFATGQELLQFFAAEGLWGLGGALIFLLIVTYLSYVLLLSGQRYQFKSMDEVFIHFAGERLGRIYSLYTSMIIFSVYVLMLAAAGAIFQQSFNFPVIVGSSLMAVTILMSLMFGLARLLNLLASTGPILIALLIIVAISAIVLLPQSLLEGHRLAISSDQLRASPHWLVSAGLYSAIQVTALFSFIPAIGSTVSNVRVLKSAAVLGPLIFFAALILMILALLAGMPIVLNSQIPSLSLVERVLPMALSGFSLIILLGVFTTTAPLVWTLSVRFADDGSLKQRLLVTALIAAGLFASQELPFDRFVNAIYPSIGISGLGLILLMLARQFRQRALI